MILLFWGLSSSLPLIAVFAVSYGFFEVLVGALETWYVDLRVNCLSIKGEFAAVGMVTALLTNSATGY